MIRFAKFFVALATILVVQITHATPAMTPPVILKSDNALTADQLGVVINDNDALSARIGEYYQKVRKIPPQNIVHIQFDARKTMLEPGAFASMKRQIDNALPKHVQALALTWAAPYRVGCMSITAALAFGYDTRYCASGCTLSEASKYFDSNVRAPFDELQMRPTMMLAALDFAQAKALIDRGVAADDNTLPGTAYLVETRDQARSVRKVFFAPAQLQLGTRIDIRVERAEFIENATDVMFYFTGAALVKAIDFPRYLPGAMTDHLTSFGGQLTDSRQMSALRWLEAGATGSYGTVVEPCAFVQKFPNPLVAMRNYLDGETLIEAYWKSVEMPGQGVFIGEPLARPYGTYSVTSENGRWYISGAALKPGSYQLWGSNERDGDFRLINGKLIGSGLDVSPFVPSLELPEPLYRFYRVKLLAPR